VELDIEALRGPIEEIEDALEGVGECGGGVLHPRGLHDAATAPRVVASHPARRTDEPESHEGDEERRGEGDRDRRRGEARELARHPER
jgi:hypothetical protein